MKQNITTKQANELSEKGQKTFILWGREKKYWDFGDWEEGNNLPSIGQMIEFLDEITDFDLHDDFSWIDESELYPISGLNFHSDNWDKKEGIVLGDKRYKTTSFFIDEDLTVDNLWVAIKEILEK